MQRQVLMDKLSEFLMVEQGGLQLYRVAASRATDPTRQQQYQDFLQQTDHHRTVLVNLIERLGGNPNYVSPTARAAQVKAGGLLEVSMIVDGVSQEEIEANDLENVLLAETKDHADWELIGKLASQVDDPDVQAALRQAAQEVEPQEDDHVTFARNTASQMSQHQLMSGPALPARRWEQVISAPVPPISRIHPAPMEQGLLPPALQPQWGDTPISRSLLGLTGDVAPMPNHTMPEVGCMVVTADGEQIGTVAEVAATRFRVDAPMRPDFWLGSNIIADVSNARVRLNATNDQVNDATVAGPERRQSG